MDIIGRAKIDLTGLEQKYYDWIMVYVNTNENPVWSVLLDNYRDDKDYNFLCSLYDSIFHFDTWYLSYDEIPKLYKNRAKKLAGDCEKLVSRAKQYGQSIKCILKNDVFAVITLGSNKSSFMLPSECVTVIPYQDYGNLTASERRMLLTGNSSEGSDIPVNGLAAYGGSLEDAKSDAETMHSKMAEMKSRMTEIKEAKTEELAKLQEEINQKMAALEEKKRAMMSDLQSKLDEMELEFEKMGLQIHLLDSEIYAIRCYTGEIVELCKICNGTPAKPETPLVFYQKIRYMDEELGKLASIYNVDFTDKKALEDLLRYSPRAVELFAPSERSLMLVRVSRSGKHYVASEDYINALEDYEVYHGTRICIILRDGENIWTAWTDDDRVSLQDDAFLKPFGPRPLTEEEEKQVQQGAYEPDKDYEKRMRQRKKDELDVGLSRVFVFSILQGVVDRGIIKFPEKVVVSKPGPYVILSFAEGWIADNRYGSLSEMIERANKSVKKGDYILTTQGLRPEVGWGSRTIYDKWNNERGRGDKNRTHDVSAKNRAIYPINMIETEGKYKTCYVDKRNPEKKNEREEILLDTELKKYLNNGRWYNYRLESYELISDLETNYYISLKKSENWRTGVSAHANFRVYSDEFWNLTFLNSHWLEYILTTQKTDKIRIGGQTVDFAYLIPYLKTALEHVRTREEGCSNLLKKVAPEVLKDPEWPVKLSEWMLKNNVHSFTERNIKAFARSF